MAKYPLPLTAMLLGAALLAGCVGGRPASSNDDLGLPTTDPFLEDFVFGLAKRIGSNDLYGYEPTIRVGADGTLYVTAHKDHLVAEGETISSHLLYSKDNGTTWLPMPSPAQVHEKLWALEGDIALDAMGRFYFIDTYAADLTISRWNPGPTWESTRPVMGTIHPADDRPWLAAHGDGILYYIGNGGADAPTPKGLAAAETDGARFWFYRSEDGGLTWLPDGGFPKSQWCTLAASPADDQTVLVACDTPGIVDRIDPPRPRHVVAYLSSDRGRSWTVTEAATLNDGLTAGYPATAFDASGNAMLAWTDGPYVHGFSGRPADYPTSLWFSRGDAGGGWQNFNLTPFQGTFERPWLAAAGPGTAAIAFYGTNDTAPGPGTEWFVYALVTADGHAPAPRWTLLQLDPAPVARSSASPGDFLQCAFAPSGELHVVYGRMGSNGLSFVTGDDGYQLWHVRQQSGPNVEAGVQS